MNNNDYIVQPNEKGGYDLILGGVGLGAHETMDLINELKTKGIVPVSAEVTPYINGDVNMPQINDNAQKFTDDRLEQNYNMSIDPNAEPGLKPSEEDLYEQSDLKQLENSENELSQRDVKIMTRQLDFMANRKQIEGHTYGENISFYQYNYNNIDYHVTMYNEPSKRHDYSRPITQHFEKPTSYYILDGYNGNVSEINLTWLASNDKILLHPNEGLNSVKLNVENIEDMYIAPDVDAKNKIESLDFDISVKPSLRSFFSLNSFIQGNKSIIRNVNIKDSDNKLFNTIVSKLFQINGLNVTFTKEEMDKMLQQVSENLEQNYNMSMNPNAEPGLKPSEEEHHKTR